MRLNQENATSIHIYIVHGRFMGFGVVFFEHFLFSLTNNALVMCIYILCEKHNLLLTHSIINKIFGADQNVFVLLNVVPFIYATTCHILYHNKWERNKYSLKVLVTFVYKILEILRGDDDWNSFELLIWFLYSIFQKWSEQVTIC